LELKKNVLEMVLRKRDAPSKGLSVVRWTLYTKVEMTTLDKSNEMTEAENDAKSCIQVD
jgi:hypothetical protein